MPPTIIKDLAARAPRLQGASDGALLPGVPRGRLAHDLRGRPPADLRLHREVVARPTPTRCRSGTPGSPAWPTCSARCCSTVPPKIGSRSPGDLKDTLRLAWRHRGLDVRTIGDVTRLMTMSIADLLDDWFESTAGQGRARRQRRHRHVGRPVRAGHRVRHGAPLDRRRRRRAARQLGLPRGRHGRRLRRDPPLGRVVRRRGPHRRRRRAGCSSTTAASRRRARGRHASCARRSSSRACTRRPRSSTTSAARDLPDDFVRDIEHWKSRSGVVKVNLALAELPDFTADPGTEHAGAPHRLGRDGAERWSSSSAPSRTPARDGRPPRPFCDGVIPTTLDKTLDPEGTHIMSLFTQWVPSDWSEEPHTEELEAYADRVIDLYDEVAPNFKASILHRDVVGPLRDGARVRPDRRQHLPRRAVARAAVPHAPGAGLRRLPHPDRRALQRQLGDARRRRRVRHPRHAGGRGGDRRQEAGRALVRQRLASSDAADDALRVRAMLSARSVAVVGASARPGSFGQRLGAPRSAAARRSPDVHLVNPRYDEVLGRPCVAILDDDRRLRSTWSLLGRP